MRGSKGFAFDAIIDRRTAVQAQEQLVLTIHSFDDGDASNVALVAIASDSIHHNASHVATMSRLTMEQQHRKQLFRSDS